MTANQISFAKLQEDIRHNLATEGEAFRHNIETEDISRVANDISARNVSVQEAHYVRSDAINEEHYARMDAETSRSHLAGEAETHRSNVAREEENVRSNMAREQETLRHDKAVEKETKRHNKAEEKIGKTQASAAKTQAKAATSQAATAAVNAQTRIDELTLSKEKAKYENANLANQMSYRNATVLIEQDKLAETQRHNVKVEKETKRHNKEQEYIGNMANSLVFINTPSASVKEQEMNSQTAKNYASVTESLARAGYLKTQDDWYAWQAITGTGKDIASAAGTFVTLKNGSRIITPVR